MILKAYVRFVYIPYEKALRIVLSIRYNGRNGRYSPNRTVHTGVKASYAHLTQPTDLAADWAGMDFIIPTLLCPGGTPSGRFDSVGSDYDWNVSYIGETMDTRIQKITETKTSVVEALSNFREEWELTADGESLVEVKGSVGLILLDIALAIRLNTGEQVQVLGRKLSTEVQGFLGTLPENGKGK